MSLTARIFAFAGLFLACSTVSLAEEPPLTKEERSQIIQTAESQLKKAAEQIATDDKAIGAYSRRGDAKLFLGDFAGAVTDFEKMIALDPSQDAPHWRLGIAYYFNHQWDKSAAQFAKYHAYDNRDRENGVWKFLAQAKNPKEGIEKAKKEMLEYSKFDREPFPSVYDMLAGKMTVAEVLKHTADKGPAAIFFANYYCGVQEELNGHRDEALRLLAAAVASPWGKTAEGGPAYMWQCARLHYEVIKGKMKD